MSKYGMVLILSGLFPFLLSFYPPLKFYKNIRSLCLSITAIVFIFGVWDIVATARNHWYFNPEGVGRMYIFNLPLEEALFFVVIPFCCIFTWEAIMYIKRRYS